VAHRESNTPKGQGSDFIIFDAAIKLKLNTAHSFNSYRLYC